MKKVYIFVHCFCGAWYSSVLSCATHQYVYESEYVGSSGEAEARAKFWAKKHGYQVVSVM